ncbi:MAG: hypothetical protein AABX70_07310 [Nanoarchaeota archaeon]
MKAWSIFLGLALSLSLVSALNGFSQIKDYAKNGFGVPGDVYMMNTQVEKLMGTQEGPGLVTMTDFDKSLLVPDQYGATGNGLVGFMYSRGTLTTYALATEAMRPQNSMYGTTAAYMPTTPQLSKSNMPYRPGFVKQIDMQNRGGRYSYEGQYDVARTRIIAWKNSPYSSYPYSSYN